ncbi:MAG: hypothetical protein IJY82_04735 [Oscillospiraceae bacterium]|nr:hypothetical protein [Oscillospiraceae bacterium]
MKKAIGYLLGISLLLLAGCQGYENVASIPDNDSAPPSHSSEQASSATASEGVSHISSAPESESSATEESSSAAQESTSSIKPPAASSAASKPGKNPSSSASSKNNVGTSSKKPTSSAPSENSSSVSSKQPTESGPTTESEPADGTLDEPTVDVVYYQYRLNGMVVDWFTEGDFLHMSFKTPNRYTVFDTTTGAIVLDVQLPGRPAQITNCGEEVWISYPELQSIKIHDKRTLAVKETLSFEHEISSFDFYGDYIIYAEDDQRVEVIRYNTKTGEALHFLGRFYQSDVLVNERLGCVYIGDSGLSRSTLWCYDIETMEVKSSYIMNEYNLVRRTFLYDGSVYWGGFRFRESDVSQMEAKYSWIGTFFVNDYFVGTKNGLYLRETREQILSGYFVALALTESGNIAFIENDTTEVLYIVSSIQEG